MKITKKVFDEVTKLNHKATVYLMGKKSEEEPYSVAIKLTSTGGCTHAVPEVESREITSAMVSLCKKGYTAFQLAWTTSTGFPEEMANRDYTIEQCRRNFAVYFKGKARGLDGAFFYPAGGWTVEDNKSVPVEVIE